MSRISLVALGSQAVSAALSTPSPGSNGRFRRVVNVLLPTGGQAQQMLILPDATLDVTFASREFDAKLPSSPVAVSLTTGTSDLVLRLAVARRIARIQLTAADPGDQVAVFRFDGPVVSDDPVAVGVHTPDGATLNVTDAQLIVRRRRLGTDMALAPSDVAGVTVAVDPGLSRVAFAIVGDAEGEIVLAPTTDAAGQPIVSLSDAWGTRLASALAAQLSRFSTSLAVLPDPIVVNLILEADAPCSATITAFDVGYELVRAGFSDSVEKKVLRFTQGHADTDLISIDLPDDATVLSAILRLTLAGSSTAAARRQAAVGPGADLVDITNQGISVEPSRLVVARVGVAGAIVVTGADMMVSVIEGPADVVASLWEDSGGLPGQRLVESDMRTISSGHASIVTFSFEHGVVRPSGPIWVGMTARRGRAVLALSATSGDLVATGDGTSWAILGSADGNAAAIRLRAPALVESDGNAGQGDLVLSLNNTVLTTSLDGRSRVVDLAPLLNALPAPRPTQVPVSVRADNGGVVTVDPPNIRYTVA